MPPCSSVEKNLAITPAQSCSNYITFTSVNIRGMSISEQHPTFDITPKDVADYQKLCKEKLGEDFTYEEAHRQLHKLVLQMYHIYQPITKEEVERLDAQ